MGIYFHPEQPPIVPDGFLSLGVERFYDEELRPSYVLWEEKVVPCFVLEVVSATPGGEYTNKLDNYASMGVLYYVIYSLEKVLHLSGRVSRPDGKPQDRTFRNSKRRRKPKLEIHKLVNGRYELQETNPFWMPEIGLGIGYERDEYGGLTRDWLYWYAEDNQRYPTPAEQIRQAQMQMDLDRTQLAQERSRIAQQQAQLAQQQERSAQQQAQLAQQQIQLAQERERATKLAAQLRELGIDPDEV